MHLTDTLMATDQNVLDNVTSDGESISKVGGAKTNGQIFLPTTRVGSGVARNFTGGGHNYHIFSSVFFFGRTNLKLIKKQEKL